MTIMHKYFWSGLLILVAVALFTSAAIVGGVEWVLASLGAMSLISMLGIGIYVLLKILRYSKSVKISHLEHGSISAVIHRGNDFNHAILKKPGRKTQISEEDKRLIMENIDEFFKVEQESSGENNIKAEPITKEDKKLIMAHIDKLFKVDWEQSQGMLS